MTDEKTTVVVNNSDLHKPKRPSPNPNGRPKGSKNKTTAALKDAILLAAEQTGADGTGNGGLLGYLKRLAVLEPRSFVGLLGKLLPTNIVADVTTRQADVTDKIMTPEEWAQQHQQPTAH